MPPDRSDVRPRDEFDRQVERLVRSGYPALSGLDPETFIRTLASLAEGLPEPTGPTHKTRIPFVIVVGTEHVPSGRAMTLTELGGRQGFTRMEADDLKRFGPVDGVVVPAGLAYVVTDVDAGRDTVNLTPDQAMDAIAATNRSPLTIYEGVAVVTHYPEVLRTQCCFSMPGSRCGDRRVTAMWISGGRPRLGWCWAGAPHAWLGTASCGQRVGGGAGESPDRRNFM